MRWIAIAVVMVVGCGGGQGTSATGTSGTGGAAGCGASTECDDSDPCTSDWCTVEGICIHSVIQGCSFTGSGGTGGAGAIGGSTGSGNTGGTGGNGGSAGTGTGPVTCTDGICEQLLAGQCFTSYTCSQNDLCQGTTEIPGKDDGDLCTKDTCNGAGWDHIPYTGAEISDNDQCTIDSCSSVNGITHVGIPGCTCMSAPTYAGIVAGALSQWGAHPNANGKTGYEAGIEICKTLGADHPCEYAEVRAAEAKGELSNIAMGTTAWVHRLTPEIVNGAESAPGLGGRCNDWVYITNHISDGEYVTFDMVGIPTYHLDNDTFFDGVDMTHTIIGDLQCGGVTRSILCCYPKCIP